MVSWSRAWDAALAWLAWTLAYGSIGIVVMIGGYFTIYFTIRDSLFNLASLTISSSGEILIIAGLILILTGWIIVVLAAVASFFKINSKIIAEEVKGHEQH